ncbi:hypothetical protein ABCR94_13630 [Streptomyces sp. 21So2-11]|uniref:hypothetical protein n=1 Tax=Streptomyces sp. 21So2-11 TaxID=3144408 RepID=UPI00321C2848
MSHPDPAETQDKIFSALLGVAAFYRASGIPVENTDPTQEASAESSRPQVKLVDTREPTTQGAARPLDVSEGTVRIGKTYSDELRETLRKAWGVDQVGLNKDQEPAVLKWLQGRLRESDSTLTESSPETRAKLADFALTKEDRVAVVWSRFSGKKGEVHIEHDTSYLGVAQIIAGLGTFKAVVIVGDSGQVKPTDGIPSPGKLKFQTMAEYFNNGNLPAPEKHDTDGNLLNPENRDEKSANNVPPENFTAKVIDLTEFWNDQNAAAWGGNTRTGQFKLFEYLDRHSTARHIGFRSGNLEAMALMGYPVRYLEEPDSRAGGHRMTAWHAARNGENGAPQTTTATGGKATGYERLIVTHSPTRSGQHQKSLLQENPTDKQTPEQKHATWHANVDDRLAKHLTTPDSSTRKSRPKGFTDEDLANIDDFFKEGDPGHSIPRELRDTVWKLGVRMVSTQAETKLQEGIIKKADAGLKKALEKNTPKSAVQHRKNKVDAESKRDAENDKADQILKEFSLLFSEAGGYDRHLVLRALNVEAQTSAHLLTGTPLVQGPESRLAPDNTVDLPTSQAPGGRGRGRGRGQGNRGGGARGGGIQTTSTHTSSSTHTTHHNAPTAQHGSGSGSQTTAPSQPDLTAVVQFRNESFDALVEATTEDGTLPPDRYLDKVRTSVDKARPTSYVVNAIVDRDSFAQEGRIQDFVASVLHGLSPEMRQRTAIVIGVNGRITTETELTALHSTITATATSADDALRTVAEAEGNLPVPLAVVAVPMRWKQSESFPYGRARNATMTSAATRQALHGLLGQGSYPYLSFMDFDNYPHTVPTGPHVFDHFQNRLDFDSDLLPPLRPLLMSGGYRIPGADDPQGRALLVNETRDRWTQHDAGQTQPGRRLGTLPTDLDRMVGEFDQEIKRDMRVRSRMAELAPFLPYSPEPNLFVDGLSTLIEDNGPTPLSVRFGDGLAEFNGLAESLMRLAAWEIARDHGPATGPSLSVAAEHLRPAVRGTAFVIDVEEAATQTDLSRLFFSMLKSRRGLALLPPQINESQVERHLLRIQQSHINPVPYSKLTSKRDSPAAPNHPVTPEALAELRDSRTTLTTPLTEADVNGIVSALGHLAHWTLKPALSLPIPGTPGTPSTVAGLRPGTLHMYTYAMNLLYGTDEGVLLRSFEEIASTYLDNTAREPLTTSPGSFFGALTHALTPDDTQTTQTQTQTTQAQATQTGAWPHPPAPIHADVQRMLLDIHQAHTTTDDAGTATAKARALLADAARHELTVEDLTTRLFTGRVHPLEHTLGDYVRGNAQLDTGQSTAVTFTLDGRESSESFLLNLYAHSLDRDLRVTGPDGTPHLFGPGTGPEPLRIRWQTGEGWRAEPQGAGTPQGGEPGGPGHDRPGPDARSGGRDKGKGVDRNPRTSSAPTTSTEQSASRPPQSSAPSAKAPRRRAELMENPVGASELRPFAHTKTAAVRTERFDPKLLQLNPRPGLLDGSVTLVRHHVRREQLPDGRTVRHFVVALPFRLTDGLTPTDLAAHRAHMQEVLDAHVNRGYRLPESGDQLHVTAEFVHAPTHGEAVFLSDSPDPVRADQLHWNLQHDDATVVHELLHYLGLADEYSDAAQRDPHLFRRDDLASGVREDGLMVSTRRESLENLPLDYLATIERVSDNAVIPLHTTAGPTTANPGNAGLLAPDHFPQHPTSHAPDTGTVVLKQPHYASGDQFGIATALLADKNLVVHVTYETDKDLKTAQGIAAFYKASGLTVQEVGAHDPQARVKILPVNDPANNDKKQLGVGDATKRVGKQYSETLRETVRKAWQVDADNGLKKAEEPAVLDWLRGRLNDPAFTLEKTPEKKDQVAVVWSRFSGKKLEVHIEHDTSYLGVAQIIAGLGEFKAVVIVGDSGHAKAEEGKPSAGKLKFQAMAEYFNNGTLPDSTESLPPEGFRAKVIDLTEFWTDENAKAWGGNTRTGQFKLFEYLDRNSEARHIGFRSGSLEAMALMGYPVRYLEEPNSEMGGYRMTAWHTTKTVDGIPRTDTSETDGMAPGYERLIVTQSPTRSGQHQKSLPLDLRTDAQKHAKWHFENKFAKHLAAEKSRPKGFTDEDLAGIDAYFRTGDPGTGIPPEVKTEVERLAGEVEKHTGADIVKLDKSVKAYIRANGHPSAQPAPAAASAPADPAPAPAEEQLTPAEKREREKKKRQQQQRVIQFLKDEKKLAQAQEGLLAAQAEFAALFAPGSAHDPVSVLRARNLYAQPVAHLLLPGEPGATDTTTDTTADTTARPDERQQAEQRVRDSEEAVRQIRADLEKRLAVESEEAELVRLTAELSAERARQGALASAAVHAHAQVAHQQAVDALADAEAQEQRTRQAALAGQGSSQRSPEAVHRTAEERLRQARLDLVQAEEAVLALEIQAEPEFGGAR